MYVRRESLSLPSSVVSPIVADGSRASSVPPSSPFAQRKLFGPPSPAYVAPPRNAEQPGLARAPLSHFDPKSAADEYEKTLGPYATLPSLDVLDASNERLRAIALFNAKLRKMSLLARRMRGGIDLFTCSFRLHKHLSPLLAALSRIFSIDPLDEYLARLDTDAAWSPREALDEVCKDVEALLEGLEPFEGHFDPIEQQPLTMLSLCLRHHTDALDVPTRFLTAAEKRDLLVALRSLCPKFSSAGTALCLLIDHDIPAILDRQASELSSMLVIITISTFFSSVTITGLQISVSSNSGALEVAVNACFFIALIFSVTASVAELVAIVWQQSVHRRDMKVSKLHETIILDSPPIFLFYSMTAFSLGIILLSWSSQACPRFLIF
ncbi:hypothetical protein K488DRAFT_91412 [Vararia minispora EC-137]|uniref:Uncharacterized protein n=1 Tax=Vararia minispora EC-137 TaxID=1314806 RepID=A0ACB8Q5L9_9AGAM|nr:hypothetical protein K488DRAFT_91412 [Vararia minispora EC-137]